jgi:hypothetical protein
MGGIGDQIFQYSYANYLRNKFKCNGHLDISYYDNEFNHNKFIFRLNNLAKKNNFKIVDNITYINYKFISYLRLIKLFKINKIFPFIYKFFFKIPIQNFIYEFWETKQKVVNLKNSYYFGYWHNFIYVKKIKKNINDNLLKPYLEKIKLKKFIKKINNKTVAIHIRGGDFKTLPSHNILDAKYYENAFNFYKKLLKNPNFHIFTNDIKLSKKLIFQISKNRNILFLRDYNFSDIEEFSLFSKYNYAIIANSTFSLMSSYLSFDRKISVAPSVWLKGKKLDKKKRFPKLKFI